DAVPALGAAPSPQRPTVSAELSARQLARLSLLGHGTGALTVRAVWLSARDNIRPDASAPACRLSRPRVSFAAGGAAAVPRLDQDRRAPVLGQCRRRLGTRRLSRAPRPRRAPDRTGPQAPDGARPPALHLLPRRPARMVPGRAAARRPLRRLHD